MHYVKIGFVVSLLATFSLCNPSIAQERENPITPYRPSASSPAQIPVVGQLEWELGWLRVKQDEVRRDSLPYQFKLALNDKWAFLVGGEAQVHSRTNGTAVERGIGDTSMVLKRVFANEDGSAFGLELSSKIPTAKDSIGSGKSDLGLNGIYSRDFGTVHMDANFNLFHLGAIELGSANLQKGLSASFSVPLIEKWGLTAELSGTQRKGADSTSQILFALSYSPTNRMTIDIGVAKGLNKASPDIALFSGLVIPIAQLF